MAKEYIERGALFEEVDNIPDDKLIGNDNTTFVELPRILDIISETPTADVQEVRHGRNETPFHPGDEFICSECGIVFKEMSEYIIEEDVYREFYFKFCPNCGAKMDEE